MGGHADGYQPVKLDPAVEKWSYMRENVWKTFRFTSKTARLSLLYGVLVPIGVFTICQQQDLKWDIRAARRDAPLTRWVSADPTSPVAATEEE